MNNGGGARTPRPGALVNLDSSVLLAEAGIKGRDFKGTPGASGAVWQETIWSLKASFSAPAFNSDSEN